MNYQVHRCEWVRSGDSLYHEYHDREWGVPLHDDNRLFEMLILEGAQAGLSWTTILNRRKNYRLAFDNFDPYLVANYDTKKKDELLQDSGIIRNRLKITAATKNAQVVLELQKEFGSLDTYLWSFVDGKPIQNRFRELKEIPTQNIQSLAMSKDMKKRGMSFVGPTILYAFMQAVGMVNDHEVSCFRYKEIQELS